MRWISFEANWITSADDDVIRIWNKEGEFLRFFNYEGGSVQSIYIDEINKVIVMTMLDKCIRLFKGKDPVPIMK